MKIAIAGAGAMGCRFGYMLLEAGHDVTLIDSWQEHVDAIRSKGLFVETETTQKYYPIPAMLADESQGEFELVILFTKAMQLESMLQRIKPLLPAAKVVMILSNGLGNIETLEKYVDRQKIYAGVTLWSSELEGLGILWPPVPERLNCSRLPARIRLKRLRSLPPLIALD